MRHPKHDTHNEDDAAAASAVPPKKRLRIKAVLFRDVHGTY